MKHLLAAALLLLSSTCAHAATFHLRPDGGTAEQCTGLADAAATGSRECAWAGPLVALPPLGKPRIAGGDTLVVHPGSYMVGLGAPGSETCSRSWPWDCVPAAIPSGTAAAPTRILGDEKEPPDFWGTQRARMVLNLTGSSNVEVSNLELTDHSDCVLAHASQALRCERDNLSRLEDYADNGLYAADSRNVRLSKLNIHGFANNGVLAGRLTDWTVTDVRIAANGWAGWNGDLGDSPRENYFISGNSGTMTFDGWMVEWNGCAEKYPLGRTPKESATGCWGQTGGGYGDGVGLAKTGGDWKISRSWFRFNTSDGLDLLYHTDGGTITLDRVRARGNAGNQIKVAGNAIITNAVVQANCGYFAAISGTFGVDNCRAVGDAVVFAAVTPGDQQALINSTVMGEGNTIVTAAISTDGGKPGAVVKLRNNVFVGLPFFLDPSQQTAAPYADGAAKIDAAYNVLQTLRNADCKAPSTICADAGLISATAASLQPGLKPGSPARDSGVPRSAEPLVPLADFNSRVRSLEAPDRGAVEMK